jgi:NAD(P)-dependent dehydrogenase (short-subunit alcohol dehydrogenase family)
MAGKTVFITGAASGLGLATPEALALAGAGLSWGRATRAEARPRGAEWPARHETKTFTSCWEIS